MSSSLPRPAPRGRRGSDDIVQLDAPETFGKNAQGQAFNITHSPGELVGQVSDRLYRGPTGPR